MWRTMIWASLLLLGACVSQSQSQITSKKLSELAQKAKAEGKNSVSFGVHELDTLSPGPLPQILRATSIAIAVPTGIPQVVIFGDGIVTTQNLRVERWLRRSPPHPDRCKHAWQGVADDELLMTTFLAKGTVMVDGVSITHTSQSQIDLVAGQPYLFLVQDCPGRRLNPTYWSDSFLVVAADGAITLPPFNSRPTSVASEIVNVGTVTALEDILKGL